MKLLSFNNNSNCYIALFSHLHKLTALHKLNAKNHKKNNDTTTTTTTTTSTTTTTTTTAAAAAAAAAATTSSSGLILYGASLFAEQLPFAVTFAIHPDLDTSTYAPPTLTGMVCPGL